MIELRRGLVLLPFVAPKCVKINEAGNREVEVEIRTKEVSVERLEEEMDAIRESLRDEWLEKQGFPINDDALWSATGGRQATIQKVVSTGKDR